MAVEEVRGWRRSGGGGLGQQRWGGRAGGAGPPVEGSPGGQRQEASRGRCGVFLEGLHEERFRLFGLFYLAVGNGGPPVKVAPLVISEGDKPSTTAADMGSGPWCSFLTGCESEVFFLLVSPESQVLLLSCIG